MSAGDALAAPVWMAVNVLLATAMWRAARRLWPGDLFLDCLRHTIVFCWATVVGVGTVLGAGGLLSAPALLAAVAGVAAIVWWLCRVRTNARQNPASARAAEQPTGCGWLEGYAPVERWCWLGWGVWAAFCAGRVVVSGLLEYPSNWDTLTYHLPFVGQWLRTGSLYVPGASKWFYPGNNELVALWMVGPFSGDFLAPLNNFPAAVLLALSGIELARLLGVGILTRHLGVLVLVSNYVVSHQLLDNKNDVAAAALFLSALAYAFRYVARFRKPDLILAAICLGLLSGVKYYALLYAAVGLVAMVGLTARCRGRRAVLGAGAICMAGLLIWGGYWYGRNLLGTGMPLYPRGITAEQNAQSRVRADLWRTTLLENPARDKWPLWLEALWRITGPCHVGALVLLPAGLSWLGFSGALLPRTQPGNIQRNLRFSLFGVTLGSAVLYVVTPFAIEIEPGTLDMLKTGYVTIRMALCFLSLTVLCAMVLINDTVPLPGWWHGPSQTHRVQNNVSLTPAAPSRLMGRVLGHGCIAAGVVVLAYQVAVPRRLQGASFLIDQKLSGQLVPAVLVGVDLLALGVILRWLLRRLMRWPRLWWALFGAVLLTLSAVAAGMLGDRWHRGFATHYNDFFRTGVFSFLESSVPAGERICVFAQRPYPFAGSRRQFLLLTAHPTAVQPERFRSPQAVVRLLRDQRASIVAIRRGSRFWYDLGVDQWASGHPGVFQSLLDSGTFELKRINRQLLAQALAGAAKEQKGGRL